MPKQYFTVIGLLALTAVISILLLPPSMILAQKTTFIDTKSSRSSSDQTAVRTKMDLGNSEQIRQFPKAIGEWEGIDYATSRIEEALNADVLLLRAYQSPGFYQPIFFLVMQSSDPGSFHPPPACYVALGYQIEEESTEVIHLTDLHWVSYWRSEAEQDIASSINVNRLVVFEESNGEIAERRVVLYFYVNERPASKDKLTLIRVSTVAPVDEPYEGVLSVANDFTSKVIPHLFDFYEDEEEIVAAQLAKSGAGWLLMVVSIMLPVTVMLYPWLRRR